MGLLKRVVAGLAVFAILLCAAAGAQAGQAALPSFLIIDYHPVSKTLVAGSPVKKPLYDYAYRVDIRNSGAAVSDVSAVVASTKKHFEIIQPQVQFGPVGERATKASLGTFVVRASCQFDQRLNPQTPGGGSPCHNDDSGDFGSNDPAGYNNSFLKLFVWQVQVRAGSAPKISQTLPRGSVNQATPVLSAVFEDTGGGVAPNSLVLKLDGADVSSQAQASATGMRYTPAAALADGAHQASVVIADLAGHESRVDWSFVTDTVAPGISAASPSNITTANALSAISAQFADAGTGINAASISLKVDGVDVTALSAITSSGINYLPVAKLANGAHTVQLSLGDAVGNVNSATWSFRVDQSGPQVATMEPANAAVLPADAIPAIRASIGGGLAAVNPAKTVLELDGVNITAQATISADIVSYTPGAVLSEGSHAVKLTLVDQYGNSSVASWSFVTRTAPRIVSVAPQDVTLNWQGTHSITAQFSDVGAGIDAAKTTLMLDGVDVSAQSQLAADSLNYTPSAALPQGVHLVTLAVTDKAGNRSEMSWRFTVYTGLPIISAMAPQDTLLANGMPLITAKYQDSGDPAIAPGIDPASVRMTVDGVDVTAKAQVSATGISYQPAAVLVDGLHTVTLAVTDKAGNPANATWSFLTDVGSPTFLPGFLPAAGAMLAADELPVIVAQYQSSASGVNVAGIKLELDGVDVSAAAARGASDTRYTPKSPLVEGSHTVRITVPSKAGNAAVYSWNFTTATAPVISGESPRDVFLPGGSAPLLSASYSDVGAGIDAASVRLLLDGVDVTANTSISASGVQFQAPAGMADGSHAASLSVRDRAGNTAESSWNFMMAAPPQVTAMSPKDIKLPLNSQPVISAQFADARNGIDLSGVRLLLNGQDVTSLAQVAADGISFRPAAPLANGPYTVYLEVPNKVNGVAVASWGFTVEDPAAYVLAITSPGGGMSVATPTLEVTASARSNRGSPTTVLLNGLPMAFLSFDDAGNSIYRSTVELADGANTLAVQATFGDGTVRNASTTVSYDAPPHVTFTSPADNAMLGRANQTSPGNLTGNVDRPVTITGRVSKAVTSVRINQQAAVLSPDGTEFRFDNFFLHEGMNNLIAVATDAHGRAGTASLQVSVDQTAPILTVEAPVDNAVTTSSKVDVRGMVNDAVEAFVGAPEPRVSITVNGATRQGEVADRYWLVPDVPLEVGENTLLVTATDQFGNTRTQQIKVSRIAVGTARLTMVSGNHQQAASGVELPRPLVVVALNAMGEPVAGIPVQFDVMRGTGSISTEQGVVQRPDGVSAARNLSVKTDSAGRAQVWLRAGKQSGMAANVLRASYAKWAGDVTFTATTQRGAVFKVNADLGLNQFAETGSQPLELMSVIVRDRDDNPLPNVPVVYTVEAGDAYFTDRLGGVAQDGGKRIVLNTDKNGLTALRPTMGREPGLVRISARALRDAGGNIENFDDLIGNAKFLVQSKQAQDGPASFSGYVYTDKGKPLPGVRVSVGRTALASTTDAQGRFEFDNVPPGRIDLFVDGRTVNPTNDPAQQQWPSLHFESYAVRGQDNQLPHPVYLPPLLASESKVVGGNQDVVLQIPGLQGFQMKVKANSVTFPDGSHVGTLVVSPVTADRLPMAPPAGGAQFGVPAWTVQPAGTRFDPPIEVMLPNAAGNPAGDNLPIVQWDHDLGQFVPMGRATVSEDGAYLVTDVGSGLTKAGWGGLCRYDPDKCGKTKPKKCATCERLTKGECPTCEPDPTKVGSGNAVKVSYGMFWNPGAIHLGLAELSFSAEGVLEGEMKNKCCKDTGRLGSDIGVTLQGTAGINVEGRIWGYEWHYLADGALGIFATGRLAGGLKGEVTADGCEHKTELKWLNGVATGEIGAVMKMEIAEGSSFGFSFRPVAIMVEGEMGLSGSGAQCEKTFKAAITGKAEIEVGSRKMTLASFSTFKEWGPYPSDLCLKVAGSVTP